jgi:hypothetical protein
MVAYLGLGALTAAAILGLTEVFLPWLAALIVGGAYLLVALVLFLAGRARLKRAGPPVPEETVQTIREDAEWISAALPGRCGRPDQGVAWPIPREGRRNADAVA